ncbi:LacI family DNA-binding transcriptional regulator [Xylanimonas ulmi]|uniref:LacI family transcriptional regulator n=1 Tax=Xylanimonas ulmi TaxID=228973 RepID=A0A4Q7M6C1_9MICO|nr:substrate-binding domain-containing protein [Xylanibacterium ulmi]RZS62148.1 LacI family transcriptional regulator [Xylanibacterium ulmi]
MAQGASPTGAKERRGVTIAEVAQAAGVSVPTVSKVLNGRPGVSAATRRQVEQALDEQGYQHRRPYPGSGTGLVDFVINALDTQWATTLLRGAQAEVARLGLDLVVTTTATPSGGRTWVEHLSRRSSEGVILVAADVHVAAEEELSRLRMPVVLLDPIGASAPSLPTIAATNWAGGRDATEHLIALGHTRIAVITGPIVDESHHDRLDGYRSALQRHGLPVDAALVRHGDSLVSGGVEHGRALLSLPERPTAIVSGSDEQAYGVYLAAAELGLSVPKDVSVVGFDDVDLCQWVTPALTTVRQPLREMGREAARIVVEMSRSALAPTQRTELATKLIVRRSTAAPQG